MPRGRPEVQRATSEPARPAQDHKNPGKTKGDLAELGWAVACLGGAELSWAAALSWAGLGWAEVELMVSTGLGMAGLSWSCAEPS